MLRSIILCALATAGCLVGSLPLGFLVGSALHDGFSVMHLQETTLIAIAVVPVLGITLIGGAVWGGIMDYLLQTNTRNRMIWAGALGFGPTMIVAALVLTFFEVQFVQNAPVPPLPIHQLFTVLFTPASAFVAGVGALALGIALKNRTAMAQLGLGCALAGGLAFLITDLVLDALGRRVGAPGAAESATMLTVMLTGVTMTALVSGGVIGFIGTKLRAQNSVVQP